MEKLYLLRIQLNYVIGNYYQRDNKKTKTKQKTNRKYETMKFRHINDRMFNVNNHFPVEFQRYFNNAKIHVSSMSLY